MLTVFALMFSDTVAPAIDQKALIKAMEEHSQLVLPRKAKVEAILAAVFAHDPAALKQTGATGAPYTLGYARSSNPRQSQLFTIDSLTPLEGCTHKRPSATGINWISVQWDCPASTSLPWSSIATAFRFEGQKITEVRTMPGAPLVREARLEPKPIDRGNWITHNDYPSEAKATGVEGNVRVELAVAPSGGVAECQVIRTSGHPSLDTGTCALLMARARFTPAQDTSGKPKAGRYSMGIVWALPR